MKVEQQPFVFKLKQGLTRNCPDVWEQIRKQIAHRIAAELLRELAGLPSPQGRLLSEIREEAKQICLKQGA
jgi:hypothetical protein